MRERITYEIKRIAIQSLAVACILLGIAGLILPILPGWPFVLTGMLLLSPYSERVRKLIHQLSRMHPKAEYYIGRAERFLHRIIGA